MPQKAVKVLALFIWKAKSLLSLYKLKPN